MKLYGMDFYLDTSSKRWWDSVDMDTNEIYTKIKFG